ncbi:hypothetical protein FMUND_2188 [Fusarium mundagurra]|uniref:Uncharacterized protein n=1 Tax=Fusarium mundagurra TaxID=1567541 RepID=A0A8H6DMT7_9HYPO|nr:hypothetical protein FMUND_2188 [Fusarium mundagurra]
MASAASLEQVIKIFNRIRNARNRQQDMPDVLAEHEKVISGTAAVVSAVEQEDELNTEAILQTMHSVKSVSEQLSSFVKDLSGKMGRGAAQDFTHQLFKGSSDEKRLASLVTLLTSHSANLSVAVNTAQVGLMKGPNGTRVIDAEQMRNVDQRLQNVTEGLARLEIARILDGVEPDENGHITLSDDDIAAMIQACQTDSETGIQFEEDEKAAFASGKTARIVKFNATGKHALQINAPIGEDMWADKDIVIVKRNVASSESVQANVPMENPEVFLQTIKHLYPKGFTRDD